MNEEVAKTWQGDRMTARHTVQSGSDALRDAIHRADADARFAAIPAEALGTVTPHVPLSADLLAWYAIAAPLDTAIPLYPEELILYDPRTLVARQEGYRWTVGRRDTIDAAWGERWLVIGDYGSDPVIAHTDRAGTPIALAAHGRGRWVPFLIAPSLATYLQALAVWVEVRAIDFRDAIYGDDDGIKPEYRTALDARLAPVLMDEYRRAWLLLDEMDY